MEDMKKIWRREDIPTEHKWATEDLYPTDEAWEQELATLDADKQILTAFAGHLADSAEKLFDYLENMERVDVKVSRLANYAMRKGDEDTRNAFYQSMGGKFRGVMVALGAACSFETPEIMAISDETLEGFYAQLPALEKYRRYLTNMRRRKAHTLSAAEEKLLREKERQKELYAYLIMHNMGMPLIQRRRLILGLDNTRGRQLLRKNVVVYIKEKIARLLR